MATRHLYVASTKGGVGKTTIARLLGYWFSRNRRVLLVDLDDTASLSRRCLAIEYDAGGAAQPPVHPSYDPDDPESPRRPSSADPYFEGRSVDVYPLEAMSEKGELAILPAARSELRSVRDAIGARTQDVIDATAAFYRSPELEAEFDIIIYDTGPGESVFMHAILGVATDVLIVSELGENSLEMIPDMIGLIQEANAKRALDDRAQIAGILPNKAQLFLAVHKGTLEGMMSQNYQDLVADVCLPQRTAVIERDSPVIGLKSPTVLHMPQRDKARQEGEQVCRWVERRIFGRLKP